MAGQPENIPAGAEAPTSSEADPFGDIDLSGVDLDAINTAEVTQPRARLPKSCAGWQAVSQCATTGWRKCSRA